MLPAANNDLIMKIEVIGGQPYAYYNTALLYHRHIEAMKHAPVDEAGDDHHHQAQPPPMPPPRAPVEHQQPPRPPPASRPATVALPRPGAGLADAGFASSAAAGSDSIWVGNLPPLPDGPPPQELFDFFEQFGPVARIRHFPGKNFIFLHFVDADVGLRLLHGGAPIVFRGWPLKLGPGAPAREHDSDDGQPQPNLWVGGILPGVDIAAVRELFARYGHIEQFRYLADKNCAFVYYSDVDAAVAARQQLHGYPISDDRQLKINFISRQHATAAAAPGRAPAGPVSAPSSAAVKHRIDTIASFVVKNGFGFEKVMQEKQRGNPDFDFLFGGPNHDYYLAELQRLRALPSSSSSLSSQSTVADALADRLARFLDEPRSSSAHDWAARLPPADVQQLPRALLDLLRRSPGGSLAPAAAHFVDELLTASAQQRTVASHLDPLCKLFLPYLPDILQLATEDQPAAVADRITSLPASWHHRGVFTLDIVRSIEDALHDADQSTKRRRL